MKYFLDTEFQDDGTWPELISIGIVREDDKHLYLENSEYNWVTSTQWLRDHVYPNLYRNTSVTVDLDVIANAVLEFFMADDDIEIWGYFPSYDWVLFCGLFGPMIHLPKPLPHRINDLKQLANFKGIKIKQENSIHNALEDAKWIKETYFKIMSS